MPEYVFSSLDCEIVVEADDFEAAREKMMEVAGDTDVIYEEPSFDKIIVDTRDESGES